jgi:S-adenosylmethionine:tRNA ribosyltransferase-isomerase
MDIADFAYDLPPEQIAQEPLADRDASRLLVLERRSGVTSHHAFRDLPELLVAGDLLVVNRSRVIPARLLGRRKNGGAAEILLVRPLPSPGAWEALTRPGRRLRVGDIVQVDDDLSVTITSGSLGADARRRVQLEAPQTGDIPAALQRAGHTPLPAYVQRADRPADRDRYQTVYAREDGSVAAPTAGLHFTTALLQRLRDKDIHCAELVLHVGPGTFRPVKTPRVEDHRVDPESFVIPEATAAAVRQARARGSRVVAVGTTTVRALETASRPDRTVLAGSGNTGQVILPGFVFGVVDALVTNFHMPRSSLLLLVAAFAGRERVLQAYQEAVSRGYRFFSYGDAMLLL